ncbi:sensor histidine kinase [Cohnella sp. WQ 127256]|uniref:sensor histidine kinase n=1 Tax=Cohnella sp. WQ 127256 TaxID=2938790 RepID=UPI002119A3AB|nr:histidine kinase [Cohnella sp. WQ 127256]
MKLNSRKTLPYNSIRFKLLLIIIVIVLPLILLLIYFSQYSIKVVHDQVAKSNKNLLSLYLERLDSSLLEVNGYLSTIGGTNYDLVNLASFDEDNYTIAKVNLVNRLSTDIGLYPLIDSYFIFETKRDDFFYTFNKGGTLQERETVEQYMKLQIYSDDAKGGSFPTVDWEVQSIDGQYYLFQVYKYGDVYLGAWVNVNRLTLPMSLINIGETGRSFYVTEEGIPMEPASIRTVAQVNVTRGDDSFYLIGDEAKFLLIREQSKVGDFSLVVLVQEKSILENLPFLRHLVQFISYGSLITLPLAYIMIRKTVLLPLNRILAALKLTRDGYIEYRIKKYRTSDEFQKVNEAFNQMMSQIHRLRINVYEEQLTNQRTELKLLQLQLNPHFLMNSLNIMHSLAFMKRFELIQELSINLVQYFRYMLRSNVMFVPLKDELKHGQNYLRIQELRFQDQLTYEIKCPDLYMNFEVPPLIIQTFVENTVKHAVTMDEPLHLGIEVKMVRDPMACLKITISDTGNGFPESVLETMRKGEQIQDENGEHIGIWNVQRRLGLLYHGEARIEFSNRQTGAYIDIWLPLL